jgi:hypothetical protein
MVDDDAESHVNVKGKPFAVHGDKDGRITLSQHSFGDTMIFMADDEAGFLRVGEVVAGNGRIQ